MREARTTARETALKALIAIRKGRVAQEALAACLEKSGLARLDRNLCSDLVYGCLRQQPRLAYILEAVLPKPGKLPPAMLLALEMAVYSMVCQDSAPAHAVVDQTVGLIKKSHGQRLAAVANGALRAVSRLGRCLEDPQWYNGGTGAKRADSWSGLCVYHGIPLPVANLWLAAYGMENTVALMARSSRRPFSGLRVNQRGEAGARLLESLEKLPETFRIGKYGFAFAPGFLPSKILAQDLAHWHASGDISFQAAGSMLILDRLGLFKWQGPVWDACAGSGGKSAALLENGVNVCLASDTSKTRAASLPALFKRLGLPEPAVMRADACKAPVKEWNGHILLDVPCSGLGVLARRPDIRRIAERWEISIAGHIKKQRHILMAAAALLKPGRELAYMTCALNPAENEGLVKDFLLENPGFSLKRQWQTPHNHPWLEGMYGAVIGRVQP